MSPSRRQHKSKAKQAPIILANWGRRFIAWFIDYLLINTMLAYFGLEGLESKLLPAILLPSLPGLDVSIWSPMSIIVFFLYWTFIEWYFGRSIGQLLLNVRLTDVNGSNPSLKASAIQSAGKSLLLPIDILAGCVYRPSRQRRQRLSNWLSNTVIVFIGTPNNTLEQDEYSKER